MYEEKVEMVAANRFIPMIRSIVHFVNSDFNEKLPNDYKLLALY